MKSSKAGFYWYFRSRADFERQLFGHWRELETRRVIAEAQSEADPARKVERLFHAVVQLRGSGDFLFFLRRLALRRPQLARLVQATEAERLSFVTGTLQELGVAEPVLTAESLYHLYLGWYERNRFKAPSAAEISRQLRVVSRMIGAQLGDRRSS
ncbi:MAG: hypothetical protein HY074_14160 [Deltaproteobacteria bacterium]|nr:hypothetical protein [Deltaproteobacteria bacterium]